MTNIHIETKLITWKKRLTEVPLIIMAADGLRVDEAVTVLRPIRDCGRSNRFPCGLVALEVRGILGRDGVVCFTLQTEEEECNGIHFGNEMAVVPSPPSEGQNSFIHSNTSHSSAIT